MTVYNDLSKSTIQFTTLDYNWLSTMAIVEYDWLWLIMYNEFLTIYNDFDWIWSTKIDYIKWLLLTTTVYK